jgi:hypothetical protein
MSKLLCLIFDGCHHLGMGMPDIHHANSTGKVDEIPALHIPDYRSFGRYHITGSKAAMSRGYIVVSQFFKCIIF